MPSRSEMERAFFDGDASYDGLFYTGVRTTGIFCRPSCTARKPKPENVEFFGTVKDVLFAGYRACLRCKPLEGDATPDWLAPLLHAVDEDPNRTCSAGLHICSWQYLPCFGSASSQDDRVSGLP